MNSLIIDIDGTLCPIKKKEERYIDLIPYGKMITKLKEYKEKGFKIVLFTSRNMRTYSGNLELINKYTKPELEAWLSKWNIPYDEVIYGKPWPGKEGFYIDDRGIRPKEFLENDIHTINEICNQDKQIQPITEYIFKINDTNIKVRSNNPLIVLELVKIFNSYYEEGKEKADITINYIVGFDKQTPYKTKEKEQNNYNFIEKIEDNINIYMKSFTEKDKNFIKRIFNAILIKTLQQKGYVIIHGACASKNGQGIVISGNKRAGKTTTLLNLLIRGYDYVANDRLALKEENGQITVVGIPFSMGIILEDATQLFDITGCAIATDGNIKKVYLNNNEVSKKFNVSTNSVVKLNTIILPKYNKNAKNISIAKETDVVSYLGKDNIMTDNSIHEDKAFLNKLFNVKYANPEFLNRTNVKIVEQSSETFEQLDNYIQTLIKGDEHVIRLTHPFK